MEKEEEEKEGCIRFQDAAQQLAEFAFEKNKILPGLATRNARITIE